MDSHALEHGNAAAMRALRQRVGMIFQSFNLFPHLSVGRNVMLAPGLVKGCRGAEADERARALLQRVGRANRREGAVRVIPLCGDGREACMLASPGARADNLRSTSDDSPLVQWLDAKPELSWHGLWADYVSELVKKMKVEDRELLKNEVLGRARLVADHDAREEALALLVEEVERRAIQIGRASCRERVSSPV